MFRFENVWLTREDFNKLVPVWWNETSSRSSSVLTFAVKLHHCRNRIKEWCASNFYNILNTKRALSDDLQKLDLLEVRQNLTNAQQEIRSQLKAQLKSIIGDEKISWKTRAKQHWLKRGMVTLNSSTQRLMGGRESIILR